MNGLRVGELAESAGLAPSTVRFYERVGLLSPARRATNGYRVFDESALEELAFIGRAKGIGMSLDEIAELVAAWPNGECQSLQARLRSFLTERIGQVHEQLTDLGAFENQLQAVLDRLASRDPGPERCGKGCGCESDLDVTPGPSARPWGCSLSDDDLPDRMAQWRAVSDGATSMERTADAVRLVIPAAPATVAQLAQLCADETGCCAQTRFVMEIAPGQVTLTAQAPDDPGFFDRLLEPALPAT